MIRVEGLSAIADTQAELTAEGAPILPVGCVVYCKDTFVTVTWDGDSYEPYGTPPTAILEDANHRWFTDSERNKVASVATGATANDADVNLKNRSNHTGTQTAGTISDFTEAVQDAVAALLASGTNVTLNYDDEGNTLTITAAGAGGGGLDAEGVRDAIGVALVGIGNISITINDALDTITISTTATQNDTNAQLRDRTTHTGEQPILSITGLEAALVSKQATDADLDALAALDSTQSGMIASTGSGWLFKTFAQLKVLLGLTKTDVGLSNVNDTSDSDKPISTATLAALGEKADLVGGLVPSTQLPGFVDDVLEFANFAALPGTGEGGKIYITVDDNKTFRWSGSVYTIISDTIALGETPSTAYRGDRGRTAYDHSQAAHAPSNATVNDTDANLKNRGNHTGSQLASTISDFNAAALSAAPSETQTSEGSLINAATAKATPVDADLIGLMDSAASNILKKLSWANVKATLKTYFDTLYAPVGGGSDPFLAKLRQTADVTNATVTPATLTGLTFNFLANSYYIFDMYMLATSAAATTGYSFTVDLSVVVNQVGLTFSHQLATAGTLTGGYSIADNTRRGLSSGVPAITVINPIMGKGFIHTGANGGTATFMFSPEVAASATCKAGSIITVMKIA